MNQFEEICRGTDEAYIERGKELCGCAEFYKSTSTAAKDVAALLFYAQTLERENAKLKAEAADSVPKMLREFDRYSERDVMKALGIFTRTVAGRLNAIERKLSEIFK